MKGRTSTRGGEISAGVSGGGKPGVPISRYSWKRRILVSIIVAITLVLVCDFAAYNYVRFPPPATESQQTSSEAWLGIQGLDKPVDILLLGDSGCRVNLTTGPFADRMWASVINLGNTAQTSMLNDAWMLSDYLNRFGPPKTVVVTRTSVGYAVNHNIEFMANPPLPWAYWDRYGIAPDWKNGEIRDLLIAKYFVLYSDADVLRADVLKPWDLFKPGIRPRVPSHTYTAGDIQPKVPMDIATRTPKFYFDSFLATPDSTNAVSYMASLAREYGFQLYFTLQCEWDEAINGGLRSAHIAAEKEYLARFTDAKYVQALEQLPKTLFKTDQMESPNHLWHGAEQIYSEEIVNSILSNQTGLTQDQAVRFDLKELSLDKDIYGKGEIPSAALTVTASGTADVEGSVSCLAKPSGGTDGSWKVRAPAVALSLKGTYPASVVLGMTAGSLDKAGVYDLVVFVRQPIGSLSNETRIERDGILKVK
jgi:hypothetical protein